MAIERNANSVLAKLMGIERPLLPQKSQGRQRVLSDNYLRNIALVTHRERSALNFYVDKDESTMAVDEHVENEDNAQRLEGTYLDGFCNLLDGSDNVHLSMYRRSSSVKTKLEEVKFVHQDQRSTQLEGLGPRGNVRLCSELGCLSNSGSSHDSVIKKNKSIKACIWQEKPQQYMDCSCFTCNTTKDCFKMANGCRSPSKRIVELNTHDSKYLSGRSPLRSSPSGGGKQNILSSVRDEEISFQGRKVKNLHNGIKSPIQDHMSAREIAKLVTSEVKHSIWHGFVDVSDSGPRANKSSVNEDVGAMSSSSCLSSLDDEFNMLSFEPIKKSDCQDVCRTKKVLLERWRTIKNDYKARNSRESCDRVHYRMPFTASDMNGWQVAARRYLSKPTIFPSAWLPRSRTRDLNLDSSWCLRLEKQESFKGDNLVGDNFPGEVLRSTLESSGAGFSLGDYDMRKVLRKLNDSKKLEDSIMSEEAFSAPESSSESSVLQYIESPTYHEALVTLSEKDEASTCFFLEDRGSSFLELCLKNQMKDDSSEPVSPVSSLEGPEACRFWLKPIVESKRISAIPEFLENNIHDFQMKHQPMDTMSLESGSEGPEMAVSSDGENEGSSVGCYREDARIIELYGTLENRDFSYVVDVLSELGFPTLNLEAENEVWRSQGYVLNSLVFDSLEKIYGKQTFWERWERKLLFDRMNVGLMEIAQSLDPISSQRKPLAKRYGMHDQELEEELWALLENQEEGSKRASCNKVCAGEMEWLEIETYTYLIVKEVESLLLDELVEEFVSMATVF